MHDPEKLEVSFSVALVRMLRNFNLLEWNLGLCISQYGDSSERSVARLNLATSSMDQKLRSMEHIAESTKLLEHPGIQQQLIEWIKRADEARGTRNSFAHGHWEVLPLSKGAPIRLHAPPWLRERLDLREPIRMNVEELVAVADEMEKLVQDFLALRPSLMW